MWNAACPYSFFFYSSFYSGTHSSSILPFTQGEEYIDILPALVTSLSASGFLTDHLVLPHSIVDGSTENTSDGGSKYNSDGFVSKKQRGSTQRTNDPNTEGDRVLNVIEKIGDDNARRTENIHFGRYVLKILSYSCTTE